MSRLAFPFAPAASGRSATVTYGSDAHVRQMLELLIFTMPGERVMRPDFGSGLRTLVFEPINVTTVARVQAKVRDALVSWEPRIDVLEVTVTPRGDPPSTLLIELSYRVRATNTLQNLVYPFYLEEGSSG